MKPRRLFLVLVLLGALISCQTTEPIWFIATPGYVETQIATREDATRRMSELSELVRTMEQNVSLLPDETIRLIVEVLTTCLEEPK